MSIKISVLAVALLSALGASSIAQADDQSVTIGYAQAKVQDFKNINGVNVKYRYEWDSPLSVIGSFSYMSGSGDYSDNSYGDTFNEHDNVKYYSLAAGPAYRFNDFVSVYALLGAGYSKTDWDYRWSNEFNGYSEKGSFSDSSNSTSLMYGVGIQINPMPNWVVDVAYEGSQLDDGYNNHSINGFNIGIGYRF